MSKLRFLAILPLLVPVVVACSDSDGDSTPTTDNVDASAGVDSSTGSQTDASKPVDDDASKPVTDSGVDAGPRCTAAAETLLKPIDSTSTGAVTVLETNGTTKTIFVDASAGGSQAAATNPRIYLNLETLARVDVTDKTASSSTAWDIAIKRPILFTNGGDGGPGQGKSSFLADTDFDTVNAASAASATYKTETFFDDQCNPQLDATNAVKTTFDGWYEYDTSNNTLAPAAGTWIVKGGTGKTYKVQIVTYYATPDGTVGATSGRYVLKVGAL